MSVNPHWVRWIFASISSHLKTVATNNNIPVIVEGVDDATDAFTQSTDHAEIRISGPDTQQLSGEYRLFVSVNVLLSSRFGGKQKNRHAILTNAGLFHAAMSGAILVYKYGNTLADDDSYLGCLTLRSGKNDSVRVVHFGQIDPTDKIKQSVIDARYEMFLSE